MDIAIGKFKGFGTTTALPGGKSHWLIYEGKGPSDKDGFISVCLEYAQIVWDKDPSASLRKLVHQAKDYLEEMHKTPDGRNAIFSLIGQGGMESYWGIYRQLTRLYGDPEEKYKKGLEDKLREERQINQNISRGIIEIAEDMTALRVDMYTLKKRMDAFSRGIEHENLVRR